MLIARLIDLYCFVLLASVVVSWTQVPRDHPAVKLLTSVTEPVLKPVRSVLPMTGGIDFSPLVVLIALRVVARLF